MIHSSINPEKFLHTLRDEPLIAFQRSEYGFAVADEEAAFYAPMSHKGGGNLETGFAEVLANAALWRMGQPRLRTLRPTAKPYPTTGLMKVLHAQGPDPMDAYKTLAGDLQEVIDFETQMVIQAIGEFGRPDLKAAFDTLKREVMSDCLDAVITNAEAARELCEVGRDPPSVRRLKLYTTSASTALQNAMAMFLDP